MNPVKQVPVNQVPVIQVNGPGANIINQLLNLALKGGGLDALNVVNLTIQTINRPPQETKIDGPKPDDEPEAKIIPIGGRKK